MIRKQRHGNGDENIGRIRNGIGKVMVVSSLHHTTTQIIHE